MTDMKNKYSEKSNIYKWFVMIGTMCLLMVFTGIVQNCYSLFIIPVTNSMDFSRSEYSMCQTLMYIFSMISAYNGWRLYQRYGIVKVIRFASVLLVGAYLSYSYAEKLVIFYVISCVIGVGMGLTTIAAVPILLRQWFTEKIGLALGIAFMGSALGGMLFNPFANMIINKYSWQMAYRVLGIIMGAVVFSVTFLVFREKPENIKSDKGNNPGRNSTNIRNVVSVKKKLSGIKLREAAAMILTFLFSVSCTAFIYTMTPYFQDIGYSSSFASTCASVSMLILAIGKLVQGILLDRLKIRTCSYIAYGAILIGLISLVLFNNPMMFVLVLLGVFFGCPYGTVAVSYIANSISDNSDNSDVITGKLTASVSMGAAVNPVLSGVVFDITSGYKPLFIGSIIVICVCIPFLRKLFRE